MVRKGQRFNATCLASSIVLTSIMALMLGEFAIANIITSGDIAGTGTPYNGTDNPWVTSNMTVGNASSGNMTVTDGFVVNDGGSSVIANSSSPTASVVTIEGADSKWTQYYNLSVGYVGMGVLNITDGGTVQTGGSNEFVGYESGSNGTVNIGGGSGVSTWTNKYSLGVGREGVGTVNVVGGGLLATNWAYVGGGTASSGTVRVGDDNGTATWQNYSDMRIGENGLGELNITGGGIVSSHVCILGNSSSGKGTVRIGGGAGVATWNPGGILAGYQGAAVINATGGAVITGGLNLGQRPGSQSMVTIGGGTGNAIWNNFDIIFGAGNGSLNMIGGALVTGNAKINSSSSVGANVSVGDGNGVAQWNAGKISVGYDDRKGRLTVNSGGDIRISGTLVTGMDGIVDLSGGGTITIGNSGTLTPAPGSILINSGSHAIGTGTIIGAVVNDGGTLTPGFSISDTTSFQHTSGVIRIEGSYTQNAAATLSIDLYSPHDALVVSGHLALAGALYVGNPGFQLVAGHSIDFFDFGSISGTFASIRLPQINQSLRWNLSQLYTTGVASIQIVGDYNGDGTVNAADYSVWRDTLGQSGMGLAADGDGNGSVEIADYQVWRQHFGETAAIGTRVSASVPEPSSYLLMYSAIAIACGLRSRRWAA